MARPLRSDLLRRLLSGIVAAAPLALAASAACGGAVTGDGTSGGASSGGSSGTNGSSGTDSSNRNCGAPSKTVHVPYQPPDCVLADASVDDDAGQLDAGLDDDAGDAAPACVPLPYDCARVCGAWNDMGGGYKSCRAVDDPQGGQRIECVTNARPCGRRHEGLAPPRSEGPASIGSYLAESAYVEQASIASFEILAEELTVHRAPPSLVRAARRSARDERRHTRVMTALARRHGVTPETVSVEPRAPRALAPMLEENAIEGCVGETYGALLAWHQSVHAAEPRVRAAMARIAEDETRHAALAWQIAAWGEIGLDASARAALAARRVRAFDELAATLATEPPEDTAAALGLPSAQVAQVMLRDLRGALEAVT